MPCQVVRPHIDPAPHPGARLCRTHRGRVLRAKRLQEQRKILGEPVTFDLGHLKQTFSLVVVVPASKLESFDRNSVHSSSPDDGRAIFMEFWEIAAFIASAKAGRQSG